MNTKANALTACCVMLTLIAQAQNLLPPRQAAKPAPAAPTNWQAGLRAKLLDGVKTIPKQGAPGPVAIFGQFAFPVIAANADGKSELALAAAAGYGKGRALIFGHNGYVGNPADEDMGRLLMNAVKWCGNSDKATVGVCGTSADVFLSGKGLKVTKLNDYDAKDLKKIDVLIVNGNSMTKPVNVARPAQRLPPMGLWLFIATGQMKKSATFQSLD